MSAEARIRAWREDPVLFVRDNFHVEPDAWQVEMLRAFPKHNRLVASACKGPGKTALMAWLGWNFLATRPHCKVPCTSITGDNLKDGLWTEFAKWQNKSEFLRQAFNVSAERIVAKQHPKTWWASARSWAKDADPSQQANTLAGLHEDYLLFLIDEVSDIPDGVVSAAEAALTGGIETKLVMMGNPTRTEGPLWRAVGADRNLWHVTRISGDPDDPNRSPRIDINEARAQIAKYGRDSYIVRVNILGLFPERQADKLLDSSDVEAAMDRAPIEGTFEHEPRILGVDVARFGDDASILSPRQGRVCYRQKELRGLRTNELAEEVLRFALKWDADAVFVDGGGMGAGVIDTCHGRGYGHLVHEVQFGMRASEADRFENKRTEMYWQAAEWVKSGGCLPKDYMLQAELTAPTYWFDNKHRVCLERSDDVKARLGRSPDRASGFVLTFAGFVAPRPTALEAIALKRREEHDPFADNTHRDVLQRTAARDHDPFAEDR
jgi:phage terminase large subunit